MSDLNPTLEALIHRLADGRWHSGEALGEAIGISRAAVSKQLKQLDKLGLDFESVKGTGYRLLRPLELFNREQILSELSAAELEGLHALGVHRLIDSTNSALMRELRLSKRIHGHFCLSEQQSAGRGRRGKSWHSPFAQNLYLSAAWHFDQGVSAIEGLSLAVGVAVVRSLESLGVNNVTLKWPNDILVGGKKLGGVLVELGGDAVSDCVAIVGVGLNVHMEDASENSVSQPWTSLKSLGANVSRNTIAAEVIKQLLILLKGYQAKGFSSYQAAWNARSAFTGEKVRLSAADSVIEGKMLGVDASGALLLELANGKTHSYIGGELSLRKLA